MHHVQNVFRRLVISGYTFGRSRRCRGRVQRKRRVELRRNGPGAGNDRSDQKQKKAQGVPDWHEFPPLQFTGKTDRQDYIPCKPVGPITGEKSYVGETVKSTKAVELWSTRVVARLPQQLEDA